MNQSIIVEGEVASNPVLLEVVSINNNLSKNRYVVYYELPGFHEQYKNI